MTALGYYLVHTAVIVTQIGLPRQRNVSAPTGYLYDSMACHVVKNIDLFHGRTRSPYLYRCV